jgi:REP element-mobilizing transposase RayT
MERQGELEMPYRRTPFVSGEHYHLYNRGNNFENVFITREDYIRFLRLLRKYIVSNRTADILAYCLMPNHYHLLVHLRSNNLSESMQAMTVAYAKGINKKYGRVGRLFQAPFQAIHVARQDYLDLLMTYIHRNPVEADLAKSAEGWEFSSYRDYVGLREGTLVEASRMTSSGVGRMAALVDNFGKRESDMIAGMTLE